MVPIPEDSKSYSEYSDQTTDYGSSSEGHDTPGELAGWLSDVGVWIGELVIDVGVTTEYHFKSGVTGTLGAGMHFGGDAGWEKSQSKAALRLSPCVS